MLTSPVYRVQPKVNLEFQTPVINPTDSTDLCPPRDIFTKINVNIGPDRLFATTIALLETDLVLLEPAFSPHNATTIHTGVVLTAMTTLAHHAIQLQRVAIDKLFKLTRNLHFVATGTGRQFVYSILSHGPSCYP